MLTALTVFSLEKKIIDKIDFPPSSHLSVFLGPIGRVLRLLT